MLPFVAGLGWGLAPCGMVYAALLTAMLSGSFAGGAIFMAGFGLATIPPVLVAGFGTAVLLSRWRGTVRNLKNPLGWSVAIVGVISMADPAKQIGELCLGSGG